MKVIFFTFPKHFLTFHQLPLHLEIEDREWRHLPDALLFALKNAQHMLEKCLCTTQTRSSSTKCLTHYSKHKWRVFYGMFLAWIRVVCFRDDIQRMSMNWSGKTMLFEDSFTRRTEWSRHCEGISPRCFRRRPRRRHTNIPTHRHHLAFPLSTLFFPVSYDLHQKVEETHPVIAHVALSDIIQISRVKLFLSVTHTKADHRCFSLFIYTPFNLINFLET